MIQVVPHNEKLRQMSGRDNSPGQQRSDSHSSVSYSESEEILAQIRQGDLLIVDSRRRNGLILYKTYHAEFAGPGAAVGGGFDLDCQWVLPVGDLLLLASTSHEDRQKAYLIRRQWIRLTHQFTDNAVSLKRAQMILNQFETYFDRATIAQIPDDAFAMMVGVLPHTVRLARRPPQKLNVKVKS
ncbi:MAG: hypothetical protein VKK04_05390 [Synechococcales bacterium]|nr:hypothetical protein [Synechococcales bacterium]